MHVSKFFVLRSHYGVGEGACQEDVKRLPYLIVTDAFPFTASASLRLQTAYHSSSIEVLSTTSDIPRGIALETQEL